MCFGRAATRRPADSVFRSQRAAHLFSLLFSNCANGISAAWWKYTHNQHHVVPNEYERDPDIMHLPIFAMTERGARRRASFAPSVADAAAAALRKAGLNWLGKVLIAHQHWTFLPIMFVARVNLYVQSLYLLFVGKVGWPAIERPA
jgi:delta8-fatty-acid desaturase